MALILIGKYDIEIYIRKGKALEEKVLVTGVANPLTHGLALRNGKGILTNKRFLFCKHSIAKTVAIGLFINLTNGDYEYEIALEKIKKFEIISKGIRGNVLSLELKDGSIKQYGILKAVDWKVGFENALSGAYNNITVSSDSASAADEIGKFKQLLDSGAITQEEFDAKKKQLLGL